MRKVLVVDDEPTVREILAYLLSSEGHEVETAANGEAALLMLDRQGPWDVVITDRAMPDMPGDELAAEIKKRSFATPVILLTGFAGPMEPVGPLAHAIDLVLKKPFTLRSVVEGIESVCKEPAVKEIAKD